jgi:hypothetical protein
MIAVICGEEYKRRIENAKLVQALEEELAIILESCNDILGIV